MSRHVYFIRPIGMAGPIKIGCSASPDKRLGALETWSPFPLEIIATLEGTEHTERQFHALFAAHHERREWFRWCPEIEEAVAAINAGTFDRRTLPSPARLVSPAQKKTPEQKRQVGISLRVGWTERETGYAPPVDYRDIVKRGDEDGIAAIFAYIERPTTGIPIARPWAEEKRAALQRRYPHLAQTAA